MFILARRLPDHRIERKKLHLSEDIVYMTIAAVLCGADTWEDIAEFGRSKKDFFGGILSLKNGFPSPDTFNRFFAGLAPGEFENQFISWFKGICKENKGVVSIDGKTIRGSRQNGNKSAIQMVSAFAQSNNMVLGQIKTAAICRMYIKTIRKYCKAENTTHNYYRLCESYRDEWGFPRQRMVFGAWPVARYTGH